MKKIYLPILAFILIGSIIALLFKNQSNQLLSQYGLKGLTVTEMVESLEAQTIDKEEMVASISATQLTISTEDSVLTFPIPDDLFYLSFAPYITKTHPCGTHNLVTCRGELKNETFEVIIYDQAGNEILNQSLTSHDNGFIGVWLPRGMTGVIAITYQEMTVTHSIQTYNDSNTCLTDLKLE